MKKSSRKLFGILVSDPKALVVEDIQEMVLVVTE
jgi:hypothetical protein